MDGNIKAFHIGAAYRDVQSPSEGVAVDNEGGRLKAQWGVRREARIYIEFEHEGGTLHAYFNDDETVRLLAGIRTAYRQAKEYLMTPEERAQLEKFRKEYAKTEEQHIKEWGEAVEIECRIMDAVKAASKLLEKDGHRAAATELKQSINAFFGSRI